MKFAITATCVLSAAVALALCGQSYAEEPAPKPSYCAGPGAYRLSECGQLTAQQMIDADAKATLGGRPRYAADYRYLRPWTAWTMRPHS